MRGLVEPAPRLTGASRHQSIIIAGCVVFAILMVALPRCGAVVLTVAALGLISGLPAGPILSLPARVLQPATRAIGMGRILHPLLCHDDVRAGRRRRLRQMDRQRHRRIRLRRGAAFAVSSYSLGLQSHSGDEAEDGVIRTYSLTTH